MASIFPCPCDSLYIPHKEILGNVFEDGNGMNNRMVDGSVVHALDGAQLYASLVDSASGRILDVGAVRADGSFSLETNLAGTFYVTLDVDSSGDTTCHLPTYWMNTGEYHGSGEGADGIADGRLYFHLVESDTITEELNLAVNKIPQSDDYFFTLVETPAYDTSMVLHADALLSPISGSDFVDGTIVQGGLFILVDTAQMNGNILYYDVNGNESLDAGEQLLPNDTIFNYDTTALRVKYAGFGSRFFEFTYCVVDNASALSRDTAQYYVDWPDPIPIELISFTADVLNEREVAVKWSTAFEIDNSHFDVERSSDSLVYDNIGSVQGHGTTNITQHYEWIDANLPAGKTILYYRLIQFDYKGENEVFGPIVVRRLSNTDQVVIFPNPTDHSVTVYVPEKEEGPQRLDMYTVQGIKVLSQEINDGMVKFDVSNLPAGSYSIMMGNTYLGRFLVKK